MANIEMTLSWIKGNERRKRRLLSDEPDESNGLLHGHERRMGWMMGGVWIIGIRLLIQIAALVKYLFFGKPKPTRAAGVK